MENMPKIMIVDDEATIAMQLEETLAVMGYDVVGRADSGDQAIEMAGDVNPDLVLMDIVMPGNLDGVSAAAMIKTQMDIPVIFLTAYADKHLVGRAKQVEPMGYILKPFTEDSIRGAVEVALYKDKMDDRLRQSEERFRAIFETAADCIFIKDRQLRYVLVNPAMERLFGLAASQIEGKSDEELFGDGAAGHIRDMDLRVLNGETVDEEDTKPIGGVPTTFHVIKVPMRDKAGDIVGLCGVARDVSETIRLQTQLQEARKMEAIATLAGGMAHEYNNALAGITGNIELLKFDFSDDENIRSCIDPMYKSARRMAKLTSQLLAYSRGGRYQSQAVHLNDIVRQALPLLQHTIDSDVDIKTNLSHDVSTVEADPTQMQMVLSDVLANAAEAIEDSGCITISTKEEDVDEEFAQGHTDLKPGRYVHLSVADDGKGLDEETRARIFEPFFTTKFMGRGLGMAAVHGIVSNHNGCIWVDSELGKGTVVHIYVPCVDVDRQEAPAPKPEVAMGTGTILVIEDEEVVLGVTRKILERLGYRVLTTKSGKDAAHIAKTYDGDIDLAILDVGLPDTWGRALYESLMQARPNLKVIVTSGYDINGPAMRILEAGAQDFIHKPYSIAELSIKVKEALEGE